MERCVVARDEVDEVLVEVILDTPFEFEFELKDDDEVEVDEEGIEERWAGLDWG